jgi:hypothetical protein
MTHRSSRALARFAAARYHCVRSVVGDAHCTRSERKQSVESDLSKAIEDGVNGLRQAGEERMCQMRFVTARIMGLRSCGARHQLDR